MGIMSWDLGPGFGFSFVEPVRTPLLTVCCEYPDMAPTEVTFGLSPLYGIHNAREAHAHEEAHRGHHVSPPGDRAGERLSTGERSVLTYGANPYLTRTGHLVFGSTELLEPIHYQIDLGQAVSAGPGFALRGHHDEARAAGPFFLPLSTETDVALKSDPHPFDDGGLDR